MKGNFKASSALTLLSDPQISTSGGNLEKLQTTAIEQLDLIRKMESESALRAVLAGLALHRIKASVKHGEFGKWIAKNVAAKKSQVNHYMRLAVVCLEQAGFSKPDLVALAVDTGDLVVSSDGAARKAFKKIQDFVGEFSLNELLIEHNIKDGGGGGGKSTPAALAAGGEDPLLADTAQHLMSLREIILDPETMKRFTAAQLRDIETQLSSALDQFRALKTKLRA